MLRLELELSDEPPPIPKDFGFHHPEDYVFERANLFVNYKILPGAGGWDDQDPQWTDDLKTWLSLRNRVQWERRRGSAPPSGDEPPPQWANIMDM